MADHVSIDGWVQSPSLGGPTLSMEAPPWFHHYVISLLFPSLVGPITTMIPLHDEKWNVDIFVFFICFSIFMMVKDMKLHILRFIIYVRA